MELHPRSEAGAALSGRPVIALWCIATLFAIAADADRRAGYK